jgi:hypothetical protein
MKCYIEIKYFKHNLGRIKETMVIKDPNTKKAIITAINKANKEDPYCEISEIIVRMKPVLGNKNG